MNQPLTIDQLSEQLLRFEPDTPCMVHQWYAFATIGLVTGSAGSRRPIALMPS